MKETMGRILRLIFGLGGKNGQPFEEIFKRHITHSLECAKELVSLCNAESIPAAGGHIAQILALEHLNDDLRKIVDDQVHEVYITRLDQEDIDKLIGNLERITNGMRTVAKKIEIFHILEVGKKIQRVAEIQHFAELIRDAIEILCATIGRMPKLSRAEARLAESRVHQLEKGSDHLFRDAAKRLYAEESDAKVVWAWYVIFQDLEDISNQCHHTAELLDAVARKMSY